MTARSYDYILTVANAQPFRSGNSILGVTSLTNGLIANVNTVDNTLKIKLGNTIQEFITGEQIYSNTTIISSTSANVNIQPYTPNVYSSEVTTASSTISGISYSKFVREKNAFEQKPLVRLYELYYPGEWYPLTANGNPTGDGAGKAWPFGFPYRFAEIRGDIISDLQYRVLFEGKQYIPMPMQSSGLNTDSSGKINQVNLQISNFDNLITQLVENPFLVGNCTSNAVSAIVNGEMVGNIDPRTVPGHALYDQDIVDSKNSSNAAITYEDALDLNGSWTPGKLDSRDLLGAVVRIKSTFANFLDVWPEYSSIVARYGNVVEMRTTLPYRVGDNVVTSANSSQQFTITAINHPELFLSPSPSDNSGFSVSNPLYIVNPDRNSDDYVLDTFKVDSLDSLDESFANFTLTSWLQYFKLMLPKRKYYKNTCAWTYKGEECQYPSSGTGTIPGTNLTANGFFTINNVATVNPAEDVCAHNREACLIRRNDTHFGAFIGTGRTIPR